MKKYFNRNVLIISALAILTILVGIAAYNFKPFGNILKSVTRGFVNNNPVASSVYIQNSEGSVFLISTQLEDGELPDSNYSETPKEVIQADVVSVSPDKKKIVYADNSEETKYSVKDLESDTTFVVDNKSPYIKDFEWSPDGKYLIAISGSSSSDVATVFNTSEYTKLVSFGTIGSKYYWPDNDQFITSFPLQTQYERPWLNGNATGIKLVTLPEGKSELLVSPSDTEDFLLTYYESGKGIVTSVYVESTDMWSKTNTAMKNNQYILDLPSRKLTPYTAGDFIVPSEVEISNALGGQISPGSISVQKNQNYQKLVLAIVRKDSSIYNSDIYIFSKNDLTKFTKLGTGLFLDWR